MADISLQAQRLPAGQAASVSFSLRVPGIVPILLAGLALRLGLAFIEGFGVDMGTFQGWSMQLASEHPWNFYRDDYFTDYAPGYMYVLWVIGEIHQFVGFTNEQYQYVLKLPSIAADLASAALVYVMLKDAAPWKRLAVPAFYLVLPPVLWIGAIWGQVDSILAFFLVLAVYYISSGRPVAGAVAYTIGFLVKPQAIAALPFLAFWIIRDQWPHLSGETGKVTVPPVLVQCTLIPLAVFVALITPFFEYQPWRILEVLYDATNVANYRVNSFWAYNFWNMGGLFDWGFRCDLPSSCPSPDANPTRFLGVATRYWGLAMFFTSLGLILFSLRKSRDAGFLALGVGLSTMAFYMFMTRMHERYVFPAMLPLMVACALVHSRALWAAFVVMAAVHFANLYHVYGYYYLFSAEDGGLYPEFIKWKWFYEWLADSDFFGFSLPLLGRLETVQVLSMLFLACFLLVLGAGYRLAGRGARREPAT